jgi:DNA-binding response OmpR family regulator
MKQILIVDDDRELANLLAFGLRLHGYAVQVAANGREALTILEERSFDAILLDWNMPVMDGERFLEQLQLRAASAWLNPIIVMTARPDLEQKARQLGAAIVLAKPFNFKELLQVLIPLLDDAR